MVTVHTAFNPVDADLVRSRLEASQFHPVIKHDVSALSMDGYALTVGGILVQVPEEEAEDAKLLLESADEDDSAA